ncbi:TetR/AcrR family transcriptional regulator [Nocardia sp. NEAU-G5]|uniref:TetR/AcrR family transcriptional regulator n=1 Tax=Nocardia albiluteola TaxID=2842303 RepID=A0ABS6BA23_9NOCA|nr:TetR/AcrR family transcriptional regulator [Nocardia albiluteola]MBU3067147.1 TetR/AcrR family transcriptional regulator [Nocardia albiluteola]
MRSRRKILDATLELIGEAGFEGVNIAAAAHAAGVTRQTVYSNFGTREDLVSQAMADLLMRSLTDIRARLAEIDNVPDYLIELLVACRAVTRNDPVLAALLRAEHGNPVFEPGMAARAKPVVLELLSPLVALDPGIEGELGDFAQIALHLGTAVVLFDDPDLRSDDDLRRFITRWLVPALPTGAATRD